MGQTGRAKSWLSWLEPQVQISRRVPSAEPPPVMSRHLPDCGLSSVPSARYCHCCAPPPLQVHSSTLVPLVVAPPVTSRHLPWTRRVPSPGTVNRWFGLPVHGHRMIGFPSVVTLPLLSTHLPEVPVS